MKREVRTFGELRAEGQGDEMALVGYAALFNTESKDLGGFRETIAPGAFTRSLKDDADVKATFNHDPNRVLGRTKSGTLKLSQDERGLSFRVQLDQQQQMHRDIYRQVQRGDISECSFAFAVGKDGQQWQNRDGGDGTYALRTLTDVDLMDVSAVCYPAYGGTSVDARSLFPDGEIVEIRSALESLAQQRKNAEKRDEQESYEDMLREVSKALAAKYPATYADGEPVPAPYDSGRFWIVETYPDYVIVCEWGTGDYYKLTYHEDEANETFLFGDPEPVEQVWVPTTERGNLRLAEFRSKLDDFAKLHKELGMKAASEAKAHEEAAAAIAAAEESKKDYRKKYGLLDDEDWEDNFMAEPDDVYDEDEEEDERAAFHAELRAAGGKVRTKKVGGNNLTADKFAWVGDRNDTSTWKLPIHDAAHVRNALARFNQTEDIPDDKKAGVYRKIKAAASKFGIEVSDNDDSRALAGVPMDEVEIQLALLRLAANQ